MNSYLIDAIKLATEQQERFTSRPETVSGLEFYQHPEEASVSSEISSLLVRAQKFEDITK